MPTRQQQLQYREPSRAKVLQFARAVFKAEAASDSEQVNAFAAAVQALLHAYTCARNAPSHVKQS